MKRLITISIVIGIFYIYVKWKPSIASILDDTQFGDPIQYKGQVYESEWEDYPEEITGYVRRVDRHFDKYIPIITYDLVLTSGEYNDPEIVKVLHKGSGNYRWSSKTRPKGSILFYHTIPNSVRAQWKLDSIVAGETITITAKVSMNSEIKRDGSVVVGLGHGNHKFILVENVRKL